jgi:protein phosphatase
MLEAFALSDKGCVRTNNEDYCLIEPELGLYVLADGMGGANAGERASRMAVETVAETILFAQTRDPQVLLSAVEEANRRVLEASQSDIALEGMGTTLVVALETGTELAIASVGDSRAYLFDDKGLRAITDDQTWVNEVGRPLGLDEESLKNHPMRHVLTMAIGASSPLTVNCYGVPLSPGATACMASSTRSNWKAFYKAAATASDSMKAATA